MLGAPAGTGLAEPQPSLRDGRTGWEALCWLIRHGDQDAYAEEEITANTDLAPAELPAVWAHNDVQRYATRYGWALEGGNGVPAADREYGARFHSAKVDRPPAPTNMSLVASL